MSILVYSIRHETFGDMETIKRLIVVAPDHLLTEVEHYCARRNEEAKEAGYDTQYRYEKSAAIIAEDASDLT